MNLDKIKNRIPGMIGEETFRQYAVLVPIVYEKGIPYFLFEKRADHLHHHPGEISFPGGRVEKGETYEACAIRETVEELLVENEDIIIIGPGDVFVSPFNLMVHPFIGELKRYQNTFSLDEVYEIIKIPVTFFYEQHPEKFENRLITQPSDDFPYDRIPGGMDYPWLKGVHEILFYRYESYTIWGMTAQIVRSVVELIGE